MTFAFCPTFRQGLEQNVFYMACLQAFVGFYFCPDLGKGPATKSDGFSEKFQTALGSPPSFSENYIANFFMTDMVAYK